MTGPSGRMVVLDVGDVAVLTKPDAQYARLGQLTGLSLSQVKAATEGDLVIALETGNISFREFASQLFGRLGVQPPPLEAVEEAWNLVLANLDMCIADAAAMLVAQRRVLWATNTSPPHWAQIQTWFDRSGLSAPACASFQVGYRKPDRRFFAQLQQIAPRVRDDAIFIDDRPENVEAAQQFGMTGYLHQDSRATADLIADLATTVSSREGT
jgi:glucose-1-phosphatase